MPDPSKPQGGSIGQQYMRLVSAHVNSGCWSSWINCECDIASEIRQLLEIDTRLSRASKGTEEGERT